VKSIRLANCKKDLNKAKRKRSRVQLNRLRLHRQRLSSPRIRKRGLGHRFWTVEADAAGKPAPKANPNLPQAHLLAAYCLRRLGPANYAASLQHLNSALQLNPKMAEAYESRGVLYVQMGKKADAQKDLATLKQLDPKLVPGLDIAIKTGKDVDRY
jgi:tetratricopeptide (TPR) repeat protein